MRLEPFALERWMTRWELDVDFDICESGILPLSLDALYELFDDDVKASLRQELSSMPLGYSEARGTLALRSALAATHRGVSPDDILVTTGAIEANFLVMNALLEPGDHVVAVSPAYQQLHSVPRAIGAEVTPWPVLRGPNGYWFDLESLPALLRSNTKLIVINSPHNPTGAILRSDELDEVLNLARDRGAWVLSDEAYRWLEIPGGEQLVEPARNRYERAVSVGTMSKPFGMPGLRVGWIAATSDLAERAWAMRDYVTLSPAKMSDAIARVAIEHRERIFARNGAIMTANLETARAWFSENDDLVSWVEPRAALLAMMAYSLPIDSMTLADRLAAEARVMLAPGSAFGMEGHLRIGIGQRPDLFAAGLDATARFLRGLA
ncbi:MAG TPA: aminotransferase class I/II-fold pyridoxal phosphate-dependent enzyme [Thermomicrobiales bacterium]|nr:aminotransferase class I/II-fold pyridoxal phosphate-dependent enzyme [Thermomicrobiales bacterium]